MKRNYLNFRIGALLLLTLIGSCPAEAQSSRIDSVMALLQQSNTAKGIDSLPFVTALNLIEKVPLTDADISKLEQAAEPLGNGRDEAPGFLVKYSIVRSLYRSDKYKSIQYGKECIGKLERSKMPFARDIKNSFLLFLRLPFRESDQLAVGLQYYAEKLNDAKKMNDSVIISNCYYVLGGFYRSIGLYEPALYHMKKSVSYIDTLHNRVFRYYNLNNDYGISRWINNAGLLSGFYLEMGEVEKAEAQGMDVLQVAMNYYQSKKNDQQVTSLNATYSARHVVEARLLAGKLDSVEYYLHITGLSVLDERNRVEGSIRPYYLQLYARYYIQTGDFEKADSLLRTCWDWVNQYRIGANQPGGIIHPDYYLAQIQKRKGNNVEAIRLLRQDIERVKLIRPVVLQNYRELADLYEKTGEKDQARGAYKAFISLQDSLLKDQSTFRTISFETEQQIAENEIAISQLENANKLSAQSRNFTIGIAALLLILAGSIYYRFQSKKKANAVLEKTLSELKTTQSQLIQSEKMASLGELTAGIAHEIQNPLNFVNNFSEVSHELLTELLDEVKKGNMEEVQVIAADLQRNLHKILHHGKRADAIVKGMLQHSSSASGKKEPVNINALTDEYLRLAYHGLRARDKSFNASMKTSYDQKIDKVSIVPQDMGRVILNLITNAFYAVHEKAKQAIDGYEPQVEVSTQQLPPAGAATRGEILISVKDNGDGIPPKVLDKIFQPFFTTKPTGQGTGLGLSLSYDIVKAHGGEIKVSTREKVGTVFIISLPV